jgi:putative flippase GtrA
MKLTPSGLLEHARSPEGRKQLRYAGIAVVFVPLGQILIQILALFIHNKHGDGNFTAASIISAAILTLPNFYANKRFVWKNTDRENLRTQVLVFWVAAMLGVTIATLLTALVEHLARHQTHLVQGVCVFIAQCVGFGLVWIGRYLILDKWLFKVTHHGEEPTPEEEAELHSEFPI